MRQNDIASGLVDLNSRLQVLKAGVGDFVSRLFDPLKLQSRMRSSTQLDCCRRCLMEGANLERAVKLSLDGITTVDDCPPLNLEPEWLEFLEALAVCVATAIDNAELLDGANAELSLPCAWAEGWCRALELRDSVTGAHTRRVTEMTLRLARAMGFSEGALVHVRRGALLHDIGKIVIPDPLLLKSGPLTSSEEEIMRLHPVYAYKMLSPIPCLRPALDIPHFHHEKWDGTGYPRGLKGEQIPLAARILAVVDVWDALRSQRPYHRAWPEEQVRAYIREQAGQYFDPQVVKAFLELEWSRGKSFLSDC